jgi:predicted transcriptional regulator
MGGEPRNERIALLVTPTTRDNLSKLAMVQRTSINLVLNKAIEQYLEEHKADIDRYNAFFGEE